MGINAVAQGLMVVYSGGFAPPDGATPAMRYAATGALIAGIPNGVLAWLIVGLVISYVLRRTTFGRSLYAIGNRERAAFLSGVRTERIVVAAFVLSGSLSALGGVLLAGYAAKAGQAMGDAYLLPAIAAVVLGGTHILGGRGTYLGTVAGVILITLLQSVLSVMQIEEWGRQFIYGVAIVGMLLIYGRQNRTS
jgi:ribose transport system permease protein